MFKNVIAQLPFRCRETLASNFEVETACDLQGGKLSERHENKLKSEQVAIAGIKGKYEREKFEQLPSYYFVSNITHWLMPSECHKRGCRQAPPFTIHTFSVFVEKIIQLCQLIRTEFFIRLLATAGLA